MQNYRFVGVEKELSMKRELNKDKVHPMMLKMH